MSDNKRAHSPDHGNLDRALVSKKPRTDEGAVVLGSITKEGIQRTSNLQAPTMQLSGHSGEIYDVCFSPDGTCLASASFDKSVFCWRTYGDCDNYMVLRGHKNAVLQVHWFTDGSTILSCSADKTIRGWDAETGAQIKRLRGHDGIVNSCCPLRRGPPLVVSGSDDGSVRIWDMRLKRPVANMDAGGFPVTAVAFGAAGDEVYSGGLDNDIKVFDLRKSTLSATLPGHADTVTGLALSPDGNHLLSNSMDNTLRAWDMRPYAPEDRCVKILSGHLHNYEKQLLRCAWSTNGDYVSCGSADRNVNVWDYASGALRYKLPGHNGSVNSVAFHPKEPIIASASSDRTLFLGELAT